MQTDKQRDVKSKKISGGYLKNLTAFSRVNVLCAAVFLFGVLYYLLTPLAGDIYVNLGSAHLAEVQYGGGVWGAIQSWDLRLFINRVFIYDIYKITRVFSDFEDKEGFLFGMKITYSILIILTSLSLSVVLKRFRSYNLGLQTHQYFLLICGVLFLHSFSTILQPEYTSLLLSLLALYFLLSSRRINYLIGIVILSMIPFFKGITAIFVIQTLCILYGYYQWRLSQVLKALISSVLVSSLIFIGLYYFYPQELVDIRQATYFQSSFSSGIWEFIKSNYRFVVFSLQAITHFPLLPIAFLTFFFGILKNGKKILYDRTIISILMMWVVGYLSLIIQGRYWVYHFVNFSIPILFSLPVLWTQIKGNLLHQRFVAVLICLLIGLFLFETSPLQKISPIQSVWPHWNYVNMQKQIKLFKTLAAAKPNEVNSADTVLYLDAGFGAVSWGTNTASRYYYPLPIQRYQKNPMLSQTSSYNEVLKVMNDYDGKYILFDKSWRPIPEIEDFDKFRHKLNSDYISYPIDSNYLIYKKNGK